MEEIVQELQKISEILLQNQTPAWLTYLSSLGPLILTGISVFIACGQHKQNQNLQKQIANRDSSNLLRQNVLEVYNAYFNGLRVVDQAVGNVADVFASPQSLQQWVYEFQRAYEMLACSYNQAKLMLDDDQLLQALKTSFYKFNDLYGCVNSYYHSGLPLSAMNNAWAVVSPKYMINAGDYVTLSQNLPAMEEFWKLCENRHTQDIRKFMEAFKSSMEDETFAALITEAEKYIGYPYVWGGSNPNTSFDCSGFVSWVLTQSGVCNTGRLGAQGLYNISTPVSSANARPGDLIFFIGTYDTPGVSHVGIYVGGGKMLHCGDPIQYADINTSYWQSHFYAFGRPPYN